MFTKSRLPHYFFGDDMNRGDKLDKNDSNLIGTSSIIEDFHASEPNLSRIPSPASSLASTKKLEWDSGADIGYNVYNSFKKSRRSKSFPSLNMDLSISQINKSDETQGDEISMENKVTDDKEIANVNYQCSRQLKIQESKRKCSFKHSTPIEAKMVSKVYNNSDKDKLKSTNKNKDECLQTTLINICSRSVQTDNILINHDQKLNKSQQTDTIKSRSSSNTGSSLSKSSSFQYIPGSNQSKSSTENTETTRTDSSHKTESKHSNCESSRSGASKINSDASNSTKNRSEKSISSNSSPLGKIIATQQSKHLITDIDKSLHILQKFINSKNYSADTKKYYARKIVSKIISSKYTDDSSTNTSNSTLSTNKSSEKPIKPNIKSKSSETKDASDYISKEKVSCGVQCDPTQKNVSTETDKNIKIAEKLEEIFTNNNKFTTDTKHKNKSNQSLDSANKNWREAETLSEKLFEARKKSLQSSHASINPSEEIKEIDKTKKNNYLIQHSKNERKRQLSWINNEISYLHKLKELLQKNDSSSNASVDADSKNKSREQSVSTIKNLSSSLSDIELKFYQEFGSSDSSKITENIENLKKLSSYLTNDQIKFIIDNDAKNLHRQTCECCKGKHVTNIVENNSETNKSSEKHESKNCLKEFESHDIYNSSFNSHSYKFYENVITSCNDSKQTSPTENFVDKNQATQKSDAGIQCTLKKKKQTPIQTDDNTSYSTEFSKDSLNNKKKVEVFYKNVANFNGSDSQSTEYGRIESEIIPNFNRTPKPGKENSYYQRKPPKYRSKHVKPSSPIAYFLTFEEESMSDFNQKKLQNQKPLENVTVKVPKIPLKKETKPDQNERYLTLQDYLHKNRPEFVRSADWRRNIVSDHTERRSRYIFTCSQMKELTSKKYNGLPEVQSKIHVCKIVNQRRHNRCMAKTFSKKLQKKTLQGEMSIATCVNVMSSD